jgi:hypothetical protein
MIDNAEPAMGAVITATSTGAVAPSCYRVSLLSGSLEVTARLRTANDLDLLMKVLEANKALFTKANALGAGAMERADRSKTQPGDKKMDWLQTKPPAKACSPRLVTKTPAKMDRSDAKQSVKADQSETDILTLT